ncbi:hypothetical protein [Lysinibacillus boronitolerans]|uniref:Uncharacterized protein n=1 Tax=Lysinibacillus boronitolerans JCM 21713 = 10a = NBRC 103108 TaxID=1294264 RepID=A0ABR4Y167_9BACI|nr:hypothetical protein [Lysinibacillus boronitolerans]KGR87067.1 hypothetical protein CD31_07550 [Lysinibacillus boronitolerans JCM 21713 = 10a = NBRC 103108]
MQMAHKKLLTVTASRYTISNEFPKFEQIIGGTSYTLADWGEKAYYAPFPRTVLAWKGANAYFLYRSVDDVGNLYETKDKRDRVYGAGGRLLETLLQMTAHLKIQHIGMQRKMLRFSY